MIRYNKMIICDSQMLHMRNKQRTVKNSTEKECERECRAFLFPEGLLVLPLVTNQAGCGVRLLSRTGDWCISISSDPIGLSDHRAGLSFRVKTRSPAENCGFTLFHCVPCWNSGCLHCIRSPITRQRMAIIA